jgi:2-polyprenyl-3-methyl-5-hydroxy-6-metoxy-1,4-benzoquinol methylase
MSVSPVLFKWLTASVGRCPGPKGMFEDPAMRDIAGNVDKILVRQTQLHYCIHYTYLAWVRLKLACCLNDEQGILPDLEGLTVADVGAGTGLFMVELDRMVGATGKLYAIEISTGFLKLLREHVETKGLSKTTVLEGSDRSPNLPAQSIDLAFLADVYHHFEKPVSDKTIVKVAPTFPFCSDDVMLHGALCISRSRI